MSAEENYGIPEYAKPNKETLKAFIGNDPNYGKIISEALKQSERNKQ